MKTIIKLYIKITKLKRMRIQVKDCEKSSPKDVPDNEEDFYPIYTKNKQIPHRDLNRYLTKEDVEMANNHRNAEHHILLGNCKLK